MLLVRSTLFLAWFLIITTILSLGTTTLAKANAILFPHFLGGAPEYPP